MCLGFEGVLVQVAGDGVARSGVIETATRRVLIGLGFVPEAQLGDTILAHSGQGVRVVGQSSLVYSKVRE